MRIASLVLILTIASPAAASELETLASTLQPGTWTELPTNDIAAALLETGGSSGFIFGYAESMRWDPVSRQAFYLGSDHGGDWRFVAYQESNNGWAVFPNPAWYTPPPSYSDAHGYDQTAVDPVGRKVYRRPYNGNVVHVYDIDAQTWSDLPDPPFAGEYGSCCDAIDFFPELGGLVWSRGNDAVWLFANDTWTLLGDGNGVGGTWLFAEYNPVHKVMIFGSGNDGILYKLSSAGEITALADVPVTIYDGSAWNGVVTVDPISGDYLVLTAPNHELHVYDVLTDTWSLASDQPPADINDGGLVAAPIDTYGLTMFTHCKSGACRVLLYKHSPGSGTTTSSSTGAGGGSASSSTTSGGTGASSNADPTSEPGTSDEAGCSCRLPPKPSNGSFATLLACLTLCARRRTRRSIAARTARAAHAAARSNLA